MATAPFRFPSISFSLMATAPFRFPSLSLFRSPSTTNNTTYLAYSRSTTRRSTFGRYHFSSSRNIPARCIGFASHEPDGDDESGNETLEIYRAFLEHIFENSSTEDELEACIEKLIRPVTVIMVKVKHEENLRRLRVVDPIAADRLEKRLDEQVERLIARARKFLTEYEEKKKDEEGHGHKE